MECQARVVPSLPGRGEATTVEAAEEPPAPKGDVELPNGFRFLSALSLPAPSDPPPAISLEIPGRALAKAAPNAPRIFEFASFRLAKLEVASRLNKPPKWIARTEPGVTEHN